jgi:hypothetical protein
MLCFIREMARASMALAILIGGGRKLWLTKMKV